MLAQSDDGVAAFWSRLAGFLEANPTAAAIAGPLLALGLWFLTLWFGRRVLLVVLRRLAERTETAWDDSIVKSRLPSRLAWLFPFGAVYLVVDGLPGLDAGLRLWIARLAQVGMVVSVVMALHAVLDGLQGLYERRPDAARRPVKGYVQLAKLLMTVAGLVLGIAAVTGSDVSTLLTGLGVSTAVILLVFKDTILAVQSSIHLTAYDMVRVGDWIEMPKFGADGDVIDMGLHTVRVRNWDKTFTTIPIAELATSSFKNWRGMQEVGGRRIKRSVQIDVHSIRFVEAADLERLAALPALAPQLEQVRGELAGGKEHDRPTNLGLLRGYLGAWLKGHPEVHEGLTLLVRTLQPTERGLPLELYLFTRTTAWGEYERIQAELFEHLFAVLGMFDLRPYQFPAEAGLVPDPAE